MAVCSPETDFLQELFSTLNAAGIRYAVMRNHESLPFASGGSDLDIIVTAGAEARAKSLVLTAIQRAGGAPIGIAETVGFFKVFALGKTSDEPSRWWGLRLDFNIGLYFRGLRLLDETVAWPLQYHHGIPVLSNGFAGVLGVLKEALNNEIFPDRYAEAARKAAHHDWPQIEALLAPLGAYGLASLRVMLLSDASPEERRRNCRKLRANIVHHAFAQRRILSFMQRAVFEWSKVRRYLNPSGLVITILGVDGAGKSTVINAILPILNEATHNAVVVQHLRPTLLPPLARLKGKKNLTGGPVLEPHGSKPSGKLVSLFRVAYLTLDYQIGYWLWTRPIIAKQPTIVIFDRYAYDMAIDPLRFRSSLSSRVANWFASLVPKPDLIFCLHANAERILGRKGELTIAETHRQVAALKEFASHERRATLISTDGTIDEARDEMLSGLLIFLMQRDCDGEGNG